MKLLLQKYIPKLSNQFILPFSIVFLLISCKTTKKIDFIDNHKISFQGLENDKLFFYSVDKTIFLSNSERLDDSYHITGYYTNVKPSSSDSKIPTNIFTKDNEYFNKVLHSSYLIYYTDGGNVKMRIAYFANNGKEKLENLNDIYNYLKKEKIEYNLIREKKDIKGIPYADIFLTKDSLYCKIKATKQESISNIYYEAKDTLSTIQFGDNRNFYNNR